MVLKYSKDVQHIHIACLYNLVWWKNSNFITLRWDSINSNSQFVLYKNFFWKILITYNTMIGLKDNVQQYCSNKLGQTKHISFKHFKLKWKCSFYVLCLFINTVSKTLHAAEWRHAGSYIPNQPHSCFLNHKTDNRPTQLKILLG